MERGLYIAASGMLTEMARQDALANDLANVSTPGYKSDRVTQRSFGEILLANSRSGTPIGRLGEGVRIDKSITDLRSQALRETGDPLDLAIEGDGFFAVRTPQGIRYTRNGAFSTDARGGLVDQMGNVVLGTNRQPAKVNADGTVDPTTVGNFNVPNARKQGDSLFTGVARGNGAGQVRTGALEGSGVDPAHAMVDMIASMRAFESGQRAITTIDETLKQAASQVGTLS
jgi:flagellar basal-body rod protein FlgG